MKVNSLSHSANKLMYFHFPFTSDGQRNILDLYPTSKNTIGVQAVTDRSPTSWQQQTTDARPNWPIILEVTSCSRETVKVQHTTQNVVLNSLVDVDEDARSFFPKDVLLR